jgi:hypothetical protein
MKVAYKGHEIDVTREKCLGGWSTLYYAIFRESDGYECMSGFEDSAETVASMVKTLKQTVDEEIKSDNPWMENEEEE